MSLQAIHLASRTALASEKIELTFFFLPSFLLSFFVRMSSINYQEEQKTEVDVIQSIYLTEFRSISDQYPMHYELHMLPFPTPTEEEENHGWSLPLFSFSFADRLFSPFFSWSHY
jgi:hypothetical protein